MYWRRNGLGQAKDVGNSISSVEWDFGGGTITSGNYNGQLGHYELHTYANEGTYDVKFKITYDEVIKVRASDPSLIPYS